MCLVALCEIERINWSWSKLPIFIAVAADNENGLESAYALTQYLGRDGEQKLTISTNQKVVGRIDRTAAAGGCGGGGF